MVISNAVLAQSAEMGALPTLYAATYPGLEGGTYIGPDGFMEQRGYPTRSGGPARCAQQEGRRAAVGGVGGADGREVPAAGARCPL